RSAPNSEWVVDGLGISENDEDFLQRHAQDLGGDLPHAGVGAGDIHAAGEDAHRAIFLYRDQRTARAGAVGPLADGDAPALVRLLLPVPPVDGLRPLPERLLERHP